MKNLKTLSREGLSTVGIPQSEVSYCESKTNPPTEGAIDTCNKSCYV